MEMVGIVDSGSNSFRPNIPTMPHTSQRGGYRIQIAATGYQQYIAGRSRANERRSGMGKYSR